MAAIVLDTTDRAFRAARRAPQAQQPRLPAPPERTFVGSVRGRIAKLGSFDRNRGRYRAWVQGGYIYLLDEPSNRYRIFSPMRWWQRLEALKFAFGKSLTETKDILTDMHREEIKAFHDFMALGYQFAHEAYQNAKLGAPVMYALPQ